MSKILVSGCGITFPGERPTWVKVLKIAGMDVTDLSGPAISNTLIVNQLLEEIYKNRYDHVVCQLTSSGKLDVELHPRNKWLSEQDSLRNFSYRGYWPSSHSDEHFIKKNYNQYLYSPSLEEQDLIFKLLHLQDKCRESSTQLHIIQGYALDWKNSLVDKLEFNRDFNIYEMYQNSKHYEYHDHADSNTVPNKNFQIELAKLVCERYLKISNSKLEKFYE
jgi:hypothetical protein